MNRETVLDNIINAAIDYLRNILISEELGYEEDGEVGEPVTSEEADEFIDINMDCIKEDMNSFLDFTLDGRPLDSLGDYPIHEYVEHGFGGPLRAALWRARGAPLPGW
jgi:hypothetical protein